MLNYYVANGWIIGTLLFGLIIFGSIPFSFAAGSEDFHLYGKQFSQTPLVCTQAFSDPNIDEGTTKQILDHTRKAVLEWESHLQNTERYIKDQAVWNSIIL